MKLLKVKPLEKIFHEFDARLQEYKREVIRVKSEDSLGMIVSADVLSKVDVPAFNRSTVDGYALNYLDSIGASESVPVFLRNVFSINMGEDVKDKLSSGECAYIPTGGMLPENANAVSMVEYTEVFDQNQVAINKALTYHSNVIEKGENIKKGEVLIRKNSLIATSELASIIAMGIKEIDVYKPLRISIISTGDELVSSEEASLKKGEIYDINSHILNSLALKDGFDVVNVSLVKDDFQLIQSAVKESYEEADIIIVSGGSSKGEKDNTVHVFESIKNGSVFVHGAAIKPGKPTICAYDEEKQKILLGLPGNPLAAMMVYKMLMGYLCEFFGMKKRGIKHKAILEKNIPASVGKAIIQPLKIVQEEGKYLANPVFIKSALISGLTKADAFTVISMDREGLQAGDEIEFEFLE